MFTADWQALCPPTAASDQASVLAASKLARDRFWAARHAGDRPAMIHWSAKEGALRRRAHGLTAMGPLPDRARAVP